MDIIKENKEEITKFYQLIDKVKRSSDYVASLQTDIKTNGFLLIDEKAYNENLKELAVLKSNLFVKLKDDKIFDYLISKGESNSQKKLYTLSALNRLEISSEEMKSLNKKDKEIIPHGYSREIKTYELNKDYSEVDAKSISYRVTERLKEIGQEHLKIQSIGREILAHGEKDWDNKQKLFGLMSYHLGDKYDDVWQELKQKSKHNELELENGNIVLNTKFLGKDQKINFIVGENKEIKEIQFIPKLNMQISELRKNNQNQDINNAIRHIV